MKSYKIYSNQKEIAVDLKRLRLERDISIEECKLIKERFKEDLSLSNWLQTTAKAFGKYGIYQIIKKILRF